MTGSGSSSSYRRPPHARAHSRQDLQAATNRARRRCSRPPHTGAKPVRIYHLTVSPSGDLKNLLVIHHCPARKQRAQQKQRRKGGGRRPRPLRPVRVSVPEFGELEVLASAPGWVGPTLQEIATDARRFGWAAATLEVEWRLQTKPSWLPAAPKPSTGPSPLLRRAMSRTGTAQRRNAGRSPHASTPPAEPTTSTTVRRVIDAKQRRPSSTPRLLPAMRPRPGRTRPTHRHAPADDRRDRGTAPWAGERGARPSRGTRHRSHAPHRSERTGAAPRHNPGYRCCTRVGLAPGGRDQDPSIPLPDRAPHSRLEPRFANGRPVTADPAHRLSEPCIRELELPCPWTKEGQDEPEDDSSAC